MINTKKMLRLSLVVALVFANAMSFAQGFKVESVKMELEDPTKSDAERNLAEAMQMIKDAEAHPKTSTDPKMFYYKGLTYLKVATRNDDLTASTPNAIDIAYEAFNKCLEFDSKKKYSENAKLNLLNVAIGLYNKGQNAYNVGDYKLSAETFDKAAGLLQYDVNGDLKRSNLTEEVLMQLSGYSSLSLKDYTTARSKFEALQKRGYRDPNLYVNLANVQLQQNDTAAALATLSEGKEYFESNKNLINMELDLYLKQGRSAELISKLDKAIEADSENKIYYFARAISYEGMKEYGKAELDYKKAIEVAPDYYDAYYNLGVLNTNAVGALVDEMNAKNVYKPSEIEKYETKINALYANAIANFEVVFEQNTEMDKDEKMELAGVMKKIYAQLNQMDKATAIKKWMESGE